MPSTSRHLLAAALAAAIAAPAAAVPVIYPNHGTQAPAPGAFTAAVNGTVYGYYTGARGGYTVLAGLRLNGVDGPPGLNNQQVPYGTRFDFGRVYAGTPLVFFIDVLTTGDRFYSDPALNPDGVNHVWTQLYGGDNAVPAGFNLAFEDLRGGGDFNYRDHSFVIGVQSGAVPEPGTWLLMVAGFGLVGVSVRRRTAATATA